LSYTQQYLDYHVVLLTGELKESDGHLLLNAPSNSTECVNKGKCFMAGEFIVSMTTSLIKVLLCVRQELEMTLKKKTQQSY
jgi:hypothetical protein